MKATDLLKKRHKSVKALFKKVDDTEDGRQRRQLMDEIADEFKIHTQIEEEIFYPAVREIGTSKAEEMVDESYEEHHVVDLALAELPEVDMAEKKLGKERWQQLGEQMEQMAGDQRRAA